MEPMALGSPPSSPSSPTLNPNYLPAFLLGDSQPATQNSPLTPGRNSMLQTNLSASDPRNLRKKLFTPNLNDVNQQQSVLYNTRTPDKPGAPKQGLFDTLEEAKVSTPILNSTMRNNEESPPFGISDNFSRISNDTLNYSGGPNQMNEFLCRSYTSPGVNNSFSNIRTDNKPSYWITIFGFPPSAASLVLAHFANCGTIIDKKFPSQGNWVHIKYHSQHEVAKALAFNGKLISNNVMVGVVPYVNKQENKENMNSPMYMSPIRARSLRQSIVASQSPNTVVPQNVPQKSTGIVSKAMEYIFGW